MLSHYSYGYYFRKLSMKIISLITLLMLSGCAKDISEKVTGENGSTISMRTFMPSAELNDYHKPDSVLRVVKPHSLSISDFLNKPEGVVIHETPGMKVYARHTGLQYKSGQDIEILPEPTASYFFPKAKSATAKWLNSNGGSYHYDQFLNVTPSLWALVSMTSSDEKMVLFYYVSYYKYPEGSHLLSLDTYHPKWCNKKSDEKTYKEWVANDFYLVRQVTQQFMDKCLAQFETDLPNLMARR